MVLAWGIAAAGLAEQRLLSDDAYYYFEIARNVALGQGVTFDSLAPTNGFHPLWTWLLVPVFALFPEHPWLPIRVALCLSIACVAATALVIQAIFSRLGAPRAGALAGLVWLLNPFTCVLAFRGMPVPLATLVFAVSIAWLARMRDERRFGVPAMAVFGATLGGFALGRTDAVLWGAAAGAVLAWQLLREGRLRALVLGGLAAVATTLLVMSPWLLWCLHTFDSIFQTSQQAKQMFALYGTLPPLASPVAQVGASGGTRLLELAAGSARNLGYALLTPVRFAVGEEFAPLRWGAALAAVLAVWWVGLAAALARARRSALARVLAPPLLLFLLLHFAVYALWLRFYYTWYFLPPVLAACVLQGVAFAPVEAWSGRRTARLAAALAVALLALTAFFTAPLFGARTAQRERDLTALGESLPAGTVAGIWNAGEVGYFMSLHFPAVRIVNLDGVVNNDLTRRAAGGEYENYLLERVDVLIESPEPYLTQVVGAERAARFRRDHLRLRPGSGWPVYEVRR